MTPDPLRRRLQAVVGMFSTAAVTEAPRCAEDGCRRPTYIDGLCKPHHDLAAHRQGRLS